MRLGPKHPTASLTGRCIPTAKWTLPPPYNLILTWRAAEVEGSTCPSFCVESNCSAEAPALARGGAVCGILVVCGGGCPVYPPIPIINANTDKIVSTNSQLTKSTQSNFVGRCASDISDFERRIRMKNTVSNAVEAMNQNCNVYVMMCAIPNLFSAEYISRLFPGPISAKSRTKFPIRNVLIRVRVFLAPGTGLASLICCPRCCVFYAAISFPHGANWQYP
jgi:hypothetical protein